MEITSTEAQNNFGQYMKFAEFEDIIVTRNGKRAIVIKAYRVPKETYSIVAEKAEAYGFKGSRISYEEFLKLSESSEERYEYIDGEVYLLASPVFDHQTAITEILNILYNRLKAKKYSTLRISLQKTAIFSENPVSFRNVIRSFFNEKLGDEKWKR